jgi:hypothetical protein
MPTYLSNELAGTLDGKTLAAPSGTKIRGNVVNARLSAPRDDTARASCGNGAKSDFLSLSPETKAVTGY